jgi:hypothetical protein
VAFAGALSFAAEATPDRPIPVLATYRRLGNRAVRISSFSILPNRILIRDAMEYA